MTSQQDRRADTRQRLIDSAATLFANLGVDATSVAAVGAGADRTTGAVYDHFGSKEGLLLAVLADWQDQTAARTVADAAEHGEDPDALCAAVWRNVTDPTVTNQSWLLLEHELWLCAARDTTHEMRDKLADRYAAVRDIIDQSLPSNAREGTAAELIALLIGLEMQHRVDPSAIPDHVAVAAIRRVLYTGAHP